MSFNFHHRPPHNKRHRSWYDSPFWGPFMIAAIGSIIVLVGQLAATVLPIYYGPSNLCDFSIKADPASGSVWIANNSSAIVTQISAWNIYPILKEYKHQINIKGSSLFQVGRLNWSFPSLRYIISMIFLVVLKPLALLFAD